MFKENFARICREKGYNPTGVLRKLGITSSAYTKWTNDSVPRNDTLKKISDFLDCSIEELLTEKKVAEAQKSSEEETPLTDIFTELLNDPNKRLLFSAMQGATGNEIKQAALILETLKKTRNEQ